MTGVTAISAGSYFALALKNDGTVVGWGGSTVPAGLTGVTAISAQKNGGTALALKNDGTVVGWGQTPGSTVPAGLTGVTAIAAGDNVGLALKSKAP